MERLSYDMNNLVYWIGDHPTTVLLFVILGLLLYASIVSVSLLRRIAEALESAPK